MPLYEYFTAYLLLLLLIVQLGTDGYVCWPCWRMQDALGHRTS